MSSYSSIYLLTSAAIGVGQVFDAFAISKYQDRKGAIKIALLVFAFGEYVWASTSFFVWRHLEEPIPQWLPLSFVAYVAYCFASGIFETARHRGVRKPIPDNFLIAGGVFGAYFAFASILFVLRN